MNFELRQATEAPVDEVVRVLNRGYSDYVVPVEFTREMVLRNLEVDDVDLKKSLLLFDDGKAIGIAVVAARGAARRLAGMCIDPDNRRRGWGQRALQEVLSQAQSEGVSRVWLEVIDQNSAAVELYRKSGFQIRRRLIGFRGQIEQASASLQIESPVLVADAIRRSGLPDLPWQISADTVERLGTPKHSTTSFWRLNDAHAVVTREKNAAQFTLRALVVDSAARRQGQATQILQAISTMFDGAECRVPALFPDEQFAAFFTAAGLVQQEISQQQMLREFRD